MDRGEGIYHILALTAVAIWGTTFVSTKLLLAEGMTPAEIMFYRFLIAYLALKLYKPTFRLPESWRDEALFAAAGLTGGSLYFLTENMALQITLASNVALLLATAPILTVLFRNPVVAGNLLFLGLVASLFCFAVWNTAVKHLGTVKTSNYIYLVPLVALISSAIVLNERITPVALGGAVLILGGVYIAENGRHIRGLKPSKHSANPFLKKDRRKSCWAS